MIKNVVFLTGAAGCLGSATARKLVQEGFNVALFDLPTSKGKELEEKLGPSTMFVPGDVTSDDDVQKALDATKNKFGNPRTIINCAAVHSAHEVFNINKKTVVDMKYFEDIMRVNVLGTFNVIRLSAPILNENPVDGMELRGLVINTSGFAAHDGQRGQSFLAGAWGAIEGMTLPLCRELGVRGVRVMTISPGLMDSNLVAQIGSKLLSMLTVTTPSPKRLGRCEEYADLVLSIIRNSFLNGEVIRLNGGLRLVL